MKKVTIFFSSFTFLFFAFSSSQAQDLENAVVKIHYANSGEFGAGILIGSQSDLLYLITAYHVIERVVEADPGENIRIEVYFNSKRAKPFVGNVENFDENLDLAVVSVPRSDPDITPMILKESDFTKLKDFANLTWIGHPAGNFWHTNNSGNISQKALMQAAVIGVSGEGIAPGASGGAVFERNKNRLIGMITAVGLNQLTNQNEASVLKIDEIKRFLDRWGIPANQLRQKRPIKKSTYVFLGLSAGCFAGGLMQNSKGEDQYIIYKDNRDESAPIYTEIGMTREEVYQDAEDKYQMRNILYGMAGGFLGAAVLVNVIHKKNPKRIAQVNIQPNYNVALNGKGSMGVSLKYRF